MQRKTLIQEVDVFEFDELVQMNHIGQFSPMH